LGKCTSHTGGTHPWRGVAWSKFEVDIRHVGYRPDTRFENTPFERMIKSIDW